MHQRFMVQRHIPDSTYSTIRYTICKSDLMTDYTSRSTPSQRRRIEIQSKRRWFKKWLWDRFRSCTLATCEASFNTPLWDTLRNAGCEHVDVLKELIDDDVEEYLFDRCLHLIPVRRTGGQLNKNQISASLDPTISTTVEMELIEEVSGGIEYIFC